LFPACTPKDKVEFLQRQINEILKQPDIQERLTTLGFDGAPSTSEELGKFMRAEFDKWDLVVRATGIKIE
jgi:tripartite-type tricarboxylate transporter receptor subunit TctC